MLVPMGNDIRAFLATGEFTDGVPRERATAPAPLPPLPAPRKIIGVGLNYRLHAAETGAPIPDQPPLFGMYANSLIPTGAAIVVPPETQQPDWEAELGVVIGRTARRVAVDDALDHVAGYVCLNDVSARDLQVANAQWMRGKAIDTFLPCGPWVLTADEVPDPQDLRISASIDGEVVQDAHTSDMIWPVAELVSFISLTMTLEPGDLIATGTPSGVGSALDPPRFLADGEVVTIAIERVGEISNPVRRTTEPG
jgi:2-keto-4-pentenoate hydratase/2-oxohepta-3-ene-1,7-dioic acid hydratase in catechol pathway